MIENDLVDCVIALGKNLFYNSIMESCLLICTNNKSIKRKNKILFIDARKELKREKTISYLLDKHISRIHNIYNDYNSIEGFSYIAEIDEVKEKEFSLNIPLYIKQLNDENNLNVDDAYKKWIKTSTDLKLSNEKLFKNLKLLVKNMQIKV